jgi:hypothetical protein
MPSAAQQRLDASSCRHGNARRRTKTDIRKVTGSKLASRVAQRQRCPFGSAQLAE